MAWLAAYVLNESGTYHIPRTPLGALLYCRSTQRQRWRVGSRGNIGPFEEGLVEGMDARERLRSADSGGPVVGAGTRHYPLSVHTILT